MSRRSAPWLRCPRAPGPLAPCLLALVLVSGCATTGKATGGGGGWDSPALPPGMDLEAWREARRAEAELAVSRVWAVASGVREVGSRLTFTWWAEQGALTLTRYEAEGLGGALGGPVDEAAVRHELETVFTRYAQRATGEVQVRLRRERQGWEVRFDATPWASPPVEAKRLPVRRSGLPAQTVMGVTSGVGRLLSAVQVPAGGAASVEVEAHLEDGRVEGWEFLGFQVTRGGNGGSPCAPSSLVAGEAIQVLLPFTQGVGPRAVCLRLALVHRLGEAQARGHVEAASVWRPPPPEMDVGFAAEYREMHEDILRRWREETREGAEWVARRGAEELAVWYAGGIVTRGVSLFASKAVPTVMRALRGSAESAAGWLRTTLSRLAPAEKQAFERLWAKVQLEGPKALSQAERSELRALMEGLEQLVHKPLSRGEKETLREAARRHYKMLRPDLKAVMNAQPYDHPVHHRRPLEYAHLFPDEDVNAAENLVMLRKPVHERINALWNRLRQARSDVTAQDVELVARKIDERFKPWYHRTEPPMGVSYSPADAEDAVWRALRRLFPEMD